MSRDADNQVETLKPASESYNENLPAPLAGRPAHPAARYTPDLFASAAFCAIVQLLALEEAERTYATRVNASMTRAADEALSNAFQFSYKSKNAGG